MCFYSFNMKIYLLLVAIFAICHVTLAGRYNVTCYYDTFSIERGGFANFSEIDLKTSLEYCTHVVYGYVGLGKDKFDIETLHPKQHQLFTQVKNIKSQYRHIKFLVSLGGDRDLKAPEKYTQLIDINGYTKHQNFINSVVKFLQKYNFDGFDLAYQFPRKQSKHQSTIKNILNKTKDTIKNSHIAEKLTGAKNSKTIGTNNKISVQQQQFTTLVNKLKNALRPKGLMLTLTVLPHVNASEYLNIPIIIGDLDFVNLGTFDYSTPLSTPHEADYLAPIQAPPRHQKRLRQSNIDSEVRHWLSQHITAGKLNIGIATYGRTWKMTKELKSSIMPITSSLSGPGQGGELTHTPGLLSWPEICFRLDKMSKTKDKIYGNYAYRSANVKGYEGIFLTYEDQNSLGAKAEYVQNNSLGGVAIFDLTLDDFRGKCKEGKFPALKAIKFKLN